MTDTTAHSRPSKLPELGKFALQERIPKSLVLEILKWVLKEDKVIDLGARIQNHKPQYGRKAITTRARYWRWATKIPIYCVEHGKPEIEIVKSTFLKNNTILAGRYSYAADKRTRQDRDYQLLHLLMPTPSYLKMIRSLRLEVGWEDRQFDAEGLDGKSELSHYPNVKTLTSQLHVKDRSRAALLLLACPSLEHVVLPIEDVEVSNTTTHGQFEDLENCLAQESGLDHILFAHPSLKYVDLDFIGPIGLKAVQKPLEKKKVSKANCEWVPSYYKKRFEDTDVAIRFFCKSKDAVWCDGVIKLSDSDQAALEVESAGENKTTPVLDEFDWTHWRSLEPVFEKRDAEEAQKAGLKKH